MGSALRMSAEAKEVPPWEEDVALFLRDAGRVLVLGVGNEVRGDDGAGTHAARLLQRAAGRARLRAPCLAVPGGAAPENFTGQITKFEPTHVILVDALAWAAPAGAISTVDPAALGGVSLSTHSMPLGVLRDYLYKSGYSRLLVLGVQPSTIELGRGMSREVKKSVRRIVRIVLEGLAPGADPPVISRQFR